MRDEEKTLEQSEGNYRALFEHSKDAISLTVAMEASGPQILLHAGCLG
jgi:hypothetical protein